MTDRPTISEIAASIDQAAKQVVRHLMVAGLVPKAARDYDLGRLDAASVSAALAHAWDMPRPERLRLHTCRTSLAVDLVGTAAAAAGFVLHGSKPSRSIEPASAFLAHLCPLSPAVPAVHIDQTFALADIYIREANRAMDCGMYYVETDELLTAVEDPEAARLAREEASLRFDDVLGVLNTGISISKHPIHPNNIQALLHGDDMSQYVLRGFRLRQDGTKRSAGLLYRHVPTNAVVFTPCPAQLIPVLFRYVRHSTVAVKQAPRALSPGETSIDAPMDVYLLEPKWSLRRRLHGGGTHASPIPHRRHRHFVDHVIRPDHYAWFGIEAPVPGAIYYWRSERAGSDVNTPEDPEDEGVLDEEDLKAPEDFTDVATLLIDNKGSAPGLIDDKDSAPRSRKPDAGLYSPGDVFWRLYSADGSKIVETGLAGRHPNFIQLDVPFTPTLQVSLSPAG